MERSTTYSHSCEEISSTVKSRNIWNTRRFTGNKRIRYDVREAGIYYSVALPPIHLSPFVPILTASSCLVISAALSVDLTLRKVCGPFAIGRLIADASPIFAEFGDTRTISDRLTSVFHKMYGIPIEDGMPVHAYDASPIYTVHSMQRRYFPQQANTLYSLIDILVYLLSDL
ncbi:uncharacterized protein ARMOST_20434 [Armillaria ostoyae]|uniref:Uncharacterized protein n=1 Tax=Armillaria ostoyae TaxID=47428 RepID=A0A284S7D3_ARMOS|nr:uncharacterized protein ARMOST_20434 [Armillaria ostoyae]